MKLTSPTHICPFQSQCLEQTAGELSQNDQWLIKKPELLRQKIERIEIKDKDIQPLYLKAFEALTQSEFSLPHFSIKSP